MCNIAIELPEEILYDIKITEHGAAEMAKKAMALYLYKMNVSIGYCAKVAGMYEEDFIKLLSDNGMSVFRFDSEEEFLEEAANA